jgi:hypothetical protein
MMRTPLPPNLSDLPRPPLGLTTKLLQLLDTGQNLLAAAALILLGGEVVRPRSRGKVKSALRFVYDGAMRCL